MALLCLLPHIRHSQRQFLLHLIFFLFGLALQFYHQLTLTNQLRQFDALWQQGTVPCMLQVYSAPHQQHRHIFFRARVYCSPTFSPYPILYLYVSTHLKYPLQLGDWLYTHLPLHQLRSPWLRFQINPLQWQRHRNLGYLRISSRHLNFITSTSLAQNPIMFLRSQLLQSFMRASHHHPSQAQTMALVFGEPSHLTHHIKKLFQYTGTSHLIAISGLHFSMLAQCLDWFFLHVFYRLTPCNPKRTAYISTCLALFFYAIIAGFSPSCLRAWLMSLLKTMCRCLYLRTHSRQILAISALLHYLMLPHHFCQIGFQLSYGIVLSALWWQHVLQKKLPKWCDYASMPIISTSWSYLYWRQLCLISPLANLIAVPWVSYLILPVCLLHVLLSPLSEHAGMILSFWLSTNWTALFWFLTQLSFYVPI